MNYSEFLDDLETFIGRGMHRGLDRMYEALQIIDHPQRSYPTLHVVGTNGKGSTLAFLNSALGCAGYKVGMTISPHLLNVNERIQINGQNINDEVLVDLHLRIKSQIKEIPLTYFEWLVLLSMVYMKEEKVDIGLFETGMGGRWDATNTIASDWVALTSVGLDHQQFLGSTKGDICREKIEVIKKNSRVFVGNIDTKLRELVELKCREVGAKSPIFVEGPLENFELGLAGDHQKFNAALAKLVLEDMRALGWEISNENIIEGFKKAVWPGRLQTVQVEPDILIDAAHNEESIRALVDYLKKTHKSYHVLFSTLSDRPLLELADLLKPIATTLNLAFMEGERCLSRLEMEQMATSLNEKGWEGVKVYSIPQEYEQWRLKIGPQQAGILTGSIHFISLILKLYKNCSF